jgi:O-antigen ligase
MLQISGVAGEQQANPDQSQKKGCSDSRVKHYLSSAMVYTMALCFFAAVLPLGGVTLDLASGLYAGAFLLALLWVAKLFCGKAHWNYSPMHYPVLGFVVYAFIRYMTSPVEYEARVELFQIILLAFFYFAISCNFHRSRDRNILLWVLFGLGLFEATYGLWQFATQSPSIFFWSRPEKYFDRAGGTYVCPNHLAGFLELIVGLIIGRLVFHRFSDSINRSALEKVILGYVGVVCFGALLCTLSRAGWVAMVLGLLTLLVWGNWKSRAFLIRLAVLAGCIAILALLAFNIGPIRKRFEETVHNKYINKQFALNDPTFGGRTYLTKATFQMFLEHPLVGTGPGTWEFFYPKFRPHRFQSYTEYAHNDVLNLCSDYGLVGFALVASCLILFYRQAFKIAFSRSRSEQCSLAMGAIISVTALLAHSWSDFNLHIPANSFLLVCIMGLTVALGEKSDKRLRKEMHPASRYALASAILVLCISACAWVLPSIHARFLFEKGTRAKDFLQWEEAVQFYERASKVDPHLTPLYENWGELYRTMSEWRLGPEKAAERKALANNSVEVYRRCLAQNSHQPRVLVALAGAYDLAGEKEAAEKTYHDALRLDPRGAMIYLAMGGFYRRNDEDAKALEAFKIAADEAWGYQDNVSLLNIEDLMQSKKASKD